MEDTQRTVFCNVIEPGHVKQHLAVTCYTHNGKVIISVPKANITLAFESPDAMNASKSINELAVKGG